MKGGGIPAAAAIMPSPLFLWRFKVLQPSTPLSAMLYHCGTILDGSSALFV
jgi:hypothetical protein